MTTSEAITMMPVTAGVFCWNELATRDVGASCKFYTALFGWNAETNEVDGTPYTMFYSNGHPVGGCLAIDENWPADMPSCWGSYIAVDDVAAAVKRAEECGGSLCFGPLTVTDVGEFAGLVDPSGAVISVFNGGDGENPVGNGVEDDIDIATGVSEDCDGNGVPDECDWPDQPDCDEDGLLDGCEVDLDANGIPDDCECHADFDGNDAVWVQDLLILIGNWGVTTPGNEWIPGDLDFDRDVDVQDLLLFIDAWGPCP